MLKSLSLGGTNWMRLTQRIVARVFESPQHMYRHICRKARPLPVMSQFGKNGSAITAEVYQAAYQGQ